MLYSLYSHSGLLFIFEHFKNMNQRYIEFKDNLLFLFSYMQIFQKMLRIPCSQSGSQERDLFFFIVVLEILHCFISQVVSLSDSYFQFLNFVLISIIRNTASDKISCIPHSLHKCQLSSTIVPVYPHDLILPSFLP